MQLPGRLENALGQVGPVRARGLRDTQICGTLYDMKNAITIRLDPGLVKLLDRLSRQTGGMRSDLVRDALPPHLSLLRFEQLRRKVMPFAEARGYLKDEEIARDVS
jgi:predicted transcriptional regulator